MIDIKREGTFVKVVVDSQWPISGQYSFQWDTGRNDFACLLSENLKNKMVRDIERMRRDAYNQGWKDAKAKAKKETWFSGWW